MVDWIVSTVLEKLKTEVAMLVDISDEIEKLSSTFTSIQALLEDAESRRVKDRSVKIWLEKVKDVAYDVDDILDDWMTEALKSEVADEGDGFSLSKKRKVISFLSPFTYINPLMLRLKIGSRIKEVRSRLDDIEKDKSQLCLRVYSAERECVVRRAEIGERETGSLVNRSSIVGREREKDEVVHLLLQEVTEVPFVISIVGMGGLGKTTLAQLIYNDENVRRHFDIWMWVCVSEDFHVKRITKSIIESATGNGCELSDLAPLQDRLQGLLQAKRFLLVLDDVWSHDCELWDKLRLPFQAGALGSRIIVTTRLEDVASRMGSTHMQKLDVLSDDDCWLVFSRRALKHRSTEERSDLEEIGRQIVNRCGGVPLAAKTIGSAMCSRKTRRQWELVLRSKLWNSGDVLGGILPALLLSYHDLSPALKQCFAYLSIFPKDWEIEKDTIVKLWEAQGFICLEGSEDTEETGGLYFDDLLRRSLLQDAEVGYVQRYKMHDLVHDLAQSVAGSECSVVEMRKQSSLNLNNLRHLFLIDSDDEADEVASIWGTLYKAQKLRTLLQDDSRISRKWYSIKVPNNLFHHFGHLRALDLRGTSNRKLPQTVGNLKHLRYLDLSFSEIKELPEEVSNCRNLQTLKLNLCDGLKKLPTGMGKMKHLRYLYLSGTGIKELPEEVSNCTNLQTLNLNECDELEKLPRGIGKMTSLRHLELKNTQLNYLPQGIGKLSSLRTLTEFIVGGDDEGCKWGELKHLNHLQGSLLITGFENVRTRDEAREAELNKKQYLHSLNFEYRGVYDESSGDEEQKRTEEVLEILQPHTNLKELRIGGYGGSKLPKWTEDTSNLVKVELSFCEKCKQLPGLGKLPSLKYLEIWGMEEVRKVGGEFSGDDNNDGSGVVVSFPKLETLDFYQMPKWEEWELRGGDDGKFMPSLLELQINECRKLKALPSNLPRLPLLQKLTLEGSDVGMSSGVPLPVLPNLNHLVIDHYDEMTSFPCGWLGQLKALQTLEIRRCPKLTSLPEELQHLTMLQQLNIRICPILEERCREGGEDRYKIAHIPNITFYPC